MVALSGLFGTFIFGVPSGGLAGASGLAFPLVAAAFAVPSAASMPLTIIAASL